MQKVTDSGQGNAMTVLDTERLVLSRLSTDDAPFILALLNDPDWLTFIGDKGVRTLDQACAYILNGPVKSYQENGFGLFLIRLKPSLEPIGICGLIKREYLAHIDLGYALLPGFRGQGYAMESAIGVLGYGRDRLGLGAILAMVQPENHPSVSLLTKLGFTFDRMVAPPGESREVALFHIKV